MFIKCDEKDEGILIPPCLKHLSIPVSLDKASVDEGKKKEKKKTQYFLNYRCSL